MSDQQIVGYDPATGRAVTGYDPNTGLAIFQAPVAPPPTPSLGAQALDTVTRMGKQVVKSVPSTINALIHPVDTIKSILQAQGDEATAAQQAFQNGDHGKAALHALAYLTPVVGPMVDSMIQRTAAGQGPEVAGDLTAMMLPGAVSKVASAARIPAMTSAIPEEAAAVKFAQDRGIPVDAGTAIGNSAVRRVHQMAEQSTISGAAMGARAAAKTGQALDSTLSDLATEANAGAGARTIPQAGEGVLAKLEAAAAKAGKQANTEYSALRKIEANAPVESKASLPGGQGAPVPMQLAVDLRPAKAALRSTYERLADEAKLVPPQGSAGAALLALDRLMKSPDFAPLSVADGALGDLKYMLRKSADGVAYDKGTGALAQTVKALDDQVLARAKAAGRDAFNALTSGRVATIRKYDILKVVDRIREEPASTIKAITSAKDGGINFVRDVQKYAPESLADVGNAFLEDLSTTATREGGFKSADKLFTDWHKLGPETKHALFKDALKKNPTYINDLDNFFLIAKKLAAKENPSGTAASGASVLSGGLLYTMFHSPYLLVAPEALGATTSAVLRSPRVVRALTNGMKARLSGSTAAQAVAAAQIASAAKAAGIQLPAFATSTSTKKE